MEGDKQSLLCKTEKINIKKKYICTWGFLLLAKTYPSRFKISLAAKQVFDCARLSIVWLFKKMDKNLN